MAKLKTGTRIYGSGIVDTTLLVGVTTLTGTANQNLQVTGGAYVSGNVGIGTTNAQVVLDVIGNSKIIGILTATSFSGSGTNLTSLNASNLSSGTLPDARLSGTYTGININTAGVITATSFSGSGANLTALNASNISSGTLNNSRLPQDINVSGIVTTNSLNIGLDVGISTTRTVLATIAETTIDSFSILTFRSAKIQIQITQGTDYQISDLLVIHDGVEASLVECGSIATNQYLGNFSAIVSGNNCLVRVSMNTSSSATIKLLSQRFTI